MPEQRRRSEGGHGPRQGRPPESQIHIDLGFGEIFKGLGNFLGLLEEMAQEGKSEVHRTQEIRSPGGMRGIYGFSVKMGLGGAPVVENFGNIRATQQGPEVSEVREPMVDIFDEGDHVLVIVELPGVSEGDIRIEIKDDILALSAEGRDRKYAKEILLSTKVDVASIQRKYQNGILEIRLSKGDPPK